MVPRVPASKLRACLQCGRCLTAYRDCTTEQLSGVVVTNTGPDWDGTSNCDDELGRDRFLSRFLKKLPKWQNLVAPKLILLFGLTFEGSEVLVILCSQGIPFGGLRDINPSGIPTSTLHTNVWYHLGLAYYLLGEDEEAVAAYRSGLECSMLTVRGL